MVIRGIRQVCEQELMQTRTNYILDLDDLTLADVAIAGRKNSALGELSNTLDSSKVCLPAGFAVLVDGYRDLLATDRLGERITAVLSEFSAGRKNLAKTGRTIRNMVLDSELPTRLAVEIAYRYAEMCGPECDAPVAVRSSATSNDMSDACLSGQQDTLLNVSGVRAVQRACMRAYASLFTDRAIAYREQHGIDHMSVSLSTGIQHMVRSDIGSAGTMLSIDPDSGRDRMIVINSAWGLGEAVVNGQVIPDEFIVLSSEQADSHQLSIVQRTPGEKTTKLMFADGIDELIETVPTTTRERSTPSLSDEDVLELAGWGLAIERAYGRPVNIEWARDGQDGKIYIVESIA